MYNNSYGSTPQGGSYRAGLGTPGAAPNLPPPANGFGSEKFSLFVGNIAEGLDDMWLERIFSSAGSLTELRRIRDPAGKPKAFGFAEYGDAESVLRCLELLNGVPLCAPTGGSEKLLKVTADEKTRSRLNAFEASRAKTDAQAEAMEYAQNLLRQTLDDLKNADPSQSQDALAAAEKARKLALIPQHLQDLGPNDLPEESRGVITKEIAFFREQAAKKEAAKKAQQQERDRSAGLAAAHFGTSATAMVPRDDRNNLPQYNNNSSGSNSNQNQQQRPPQPDYQNRDQNRDQNYNNRRSSGGAFGPDAQNFRNNNNNQNSRGGFHNFNSGRGQQRQWGSPNANDRSHNRPHADDPQGYNRPVGFVRSGAFDDRSSRHDSRDQYDRRAEPAEDDMTDEEKERMRQDRLRREADFIFRDRERKWETKERTRQLAADKDTAREIGVQKNEDADRVRMAQKLAEWDDVKELEKARELFHVDRTRWRAQRRAFRQREMIEDRKDAEMEAKQLEVLQKQSESFLNQQADAFAKLSQGGAISSKKAQAEEAGGPIKLSLAERAKKEAEVKPVEIAPRRPATFGTTDEQEETGRKKRELIKLTYSDDEDEGEEDPEEKGWSAEDKAERRKRKLKELVANVPTTKEGLWSYEMRWDKLTEKILQDKIQPFATKKVIEALGTEDEDLVTAVVDKLRENASPQDLVEELEPVLEDEAVEFVIKIWRFVIFELLASMHRIKTTTV